MTMFRHILLLVGLFVLPLSCSLLEGEGEPNIFGQWRWIETSGGFAGTVTRADSVSYTRRLVLNPSGIFRKYRNDSLIVEGVFDLQRAEPEHIQWKLVYSDLNGDRLRPDDWVNLQGPDTLMLVDTCADCYRETFVR
jgi:hypothetical protein